MRLNEIAEKNEEWAISPQDMEVVFNALKNKGELDASEIMPLAKELVDDYEGYSKNVGSARFLIQRMHVLLHGMAPTGVSEETALRWMTPARPLIAFMAEKGYDSEDAIAMAREEAADRLVKLKREPAKEAMIAYYRQNKSSLTPQQDKAIRAQKDQIIQAMMDGQQAKTAFAQVIG